MGLEELFDMDNRRDRQRRDNRYSHEDYRRNDDRYEQNEYAQPHESFGQQGDLKQQFLDKLRDHPQWKIWLIAAVIIFLFIVVMAAIFLIPLMVKLFGYLSENGIQGIINAIWKGTK